MHHKVNMFSPNHTLVQENKTNHKCTGLPISGNTLAMAVTYFTCLCITCYGVTISINGDQNTLTVIYHLFI